MHLEHKILLTGTPLQNNMDELYALLNFLEPDVYYSNRKFMQEYGDMKDKATIDRLQTLLKPLMLRRMKEDVEKSIAPKE